MYVCTRIKQQQKFTLTRSSLSPGPVGSVAELGVSMDACAGVGPGLQETPPGLGVH